MKPTKRTEVFFKNGARNFQNSPPIERPAWFYVKVSRNFQRFQYFNFEPFFKKLEYRLYCFSVENTKAENASFSYKSTISEANIKRNRKVNTKCTYHKEQRFASNYISGIISV